MSFLKAGADAGGITGLGSSVGLSPTGLQGLGTAFNGIANAGGATPGYASQQAPAVDNHLQLLDPNVLRAIIAKFGPTTMGNPMGGTPTIKAY